MSRREGGGARSRLLPGKHLATLGFGCPSLKALNGQRLCDSWYNGDRDEISAVVYARVAERFITFPAMVWTDMKGDAGCR